MFVGNFWLCDQSRLRRFIQYFIMSTEALVAYSAPQGGDMQAMTGGARFEDLSYDGIMRNGNMINGLGQITDSFIGPNDFELPDPLDTRGIKNFVKDKFYHNIYLKSFNNLSF